jgi:hypothetical protein
MPALDERYRECRYLTLKAVDDVERLANQADNAWPDYKSYAVACTLLSAAAKAAAKLALKLKQLEEKLP